MPAEHRPANQQTVRQHNRALVLGRVAATPGETRAQLALQTGLTRATVSTLVDELIDARLLVEREPLAGLRGRPGSRLELHPAGPAAIGIEISVDYIAACLLDLPGAVRARRRVAVDNTAAAPGTVLRRAAGLVAELAAAAPGSVGGVAVALPGLIDGDGVVRRTPNLPRFDGVGVAAELARRVDPPLLLVDNEANLAALAEHWHGIGLSDFVHVSGEIGVGGAVVVDGRLFRGVRGFAGELGHVPVDPRGPLCGCGNRGCLEQVAGRRALLSAAQAADEEELLARTDAPARRALTATVRALATALGAVVNIVDVPAVVLGGCYARLGDRVTEPLAAALGERVVSGSPVAVLASTLGADGPMLGAAGAVRRQVIATGAAAG
jgi:predicted NBD/HSP70 family sugar kinase